MLTVLSILAVLAVLFVAAAVATREGPILADAPADVADLGLPEGPLQPEDLQAVRFGLAIRGYRMAEVDAVLDRVGAELAERDRKLAAVTSKPDPAAVPAIPVTVKSAVVREPAPVVPVEPPLDSPPPPIEPVDQAHSEPRRDSDDAEVQKAVESAAVPAAPAGDLHKPDPSVANEASITDPDSSEAAPKSDVAVSDPDPVEDVPSVTVPADKAETPDASDDADDRPTTILSSEKKDEDSADDSAVADPTLAPEPPPVEVAVVRTEVAPVPPTTGDQGGSPRD